MKVQTSELEGAALDWAVAEAIGLKPFSIPFTSVGTAIWTVDESKEIVFCNYSKSWEQCGPLIEKHGVSLTYERTAYGYWFAGIEDLQGSAGDTPLIAACRAIVASVFGDEVEIPDELVLV